MAEEVKNWKAEIKRLLDELRPDRYTVEERVVDGPEGETEEVPEDLGQVGAEWMESVIEAVAPMIPEEEMRKHYATVEVRRAEGHRTQHANQMLRKIGEEGQGFLGWLDCKREPIAIVTQEALWGGGFRIRDQRVALEAVSVDDLRAFAATERRRAAREHATRSKTCDYAESIADRLVHAGLERIGDWMIQGHEVATGTDG